MMHIPEKLIRTRRSADGDGSYSRIAAIAGDEIATFLTDYSETTFLPNSVRSMGLSSGEIFEVHEVVSPENSLWMYDQNMKRYGLRMFPVFHDSCGSVFCIALDEGHIVGRNQAASQIKPGMILVLDHESQIEINIVAEDFNTMMNACLRLDKPDIELDNIVGSGCVTDLDPDFKPEF